MLRLRDQLAEAEAQRVSAVEMLARRSELGQFFTPAPVARFMASLLEVRSLPCRLLDAGAGSGILTVAVVDRWTRLGGGPLDVTVVESEPGLTTPLGDMLDALRALPGVTGRHVFADFLTWAEDRCRDGLLRVPRETYDLVILNPPYRKINTDSPQRAVLS